MKIIRMPKAISMMWLAVIFASQIGLAAEGKVKRINETFKVSSDQVLSISNQFGDVDIAHWDKQNVKVEIEVLVDYKNEKDGQEQLDNIQIKIDKSSKRLSIRTEFLEKKDVMTNKNEKMEINYKITMPAALELELKNKFGDITLDSRTAKTIIELQFGSAKIGRLDHEENDLKFKFSDPVIIDQFGGGSIEAKFSKLELGNCDKLKLQSKMTTTNAGQIDDSELDVSYGGFNAEKMNQVNLKSSMTSIRIDRIEKGGKMEVSYGKLIIDELSKNFKSLEIESKFGPVEIGIEEGSKLKLDAQNKMSDLKLPSGYKVVKESEVGNDESFLGAIGGDGSSLPILKVNNSFGSTKIK